MKTTFLIGYMGSGKTTLGRAVAARTGIRFIDLDDYIEEREGCSIKEIFASRGEDAFRAIERDALQEVSRMADTLVACGGGTPCFGDNMDLLNRCGLTVYLDAEDAPFMERVKSETGCTPVLSEESFGGGIRAVIPSKNMLLGEAFSEKLRKEREGFSF